MTGACMIALTCALVLGSVARGQPAGVQGHPWAAPPGAAGPWCAVVGEGRRGAERASPGTPGGDRRMAHGERVGRAGGRCPGSPGAARGPDGGGRLAARRRAGEPGGGVEGGARSGVACEPGGARGRLAPDSDPWFAEDKFKHFFVSYATTGITFAAARTAGLGGSDARLVAAVAAGVAGLGKELVDAGRGTGFSARDLVWDGLGIAAALALVARVR